MEKLELVKDIAVKSKTAEEWMRFKDLFETYLLATEKTKKAEDVKIACLKMLGGRIIINEFNSIYASQQPTSLEEVVTKLEEKFKSGESEHYVSHVFWSRSQKQGETVDEWMIDLRKKASLCKFKEEDRMLRDKVVSGVACDLTRRELLKEKTLTLDKALDICLAMENSGKQLKSFQNGGPSTTERASREAAEEAQAQTVFATAARGTLAARKNNHQRRQGGDVSRYRNVSRSSGDSTIQRCRSCGRAHRMNDGSCPARGKQCLACDGFNHFAIACPKRRRNFSAFQLDGDSDRSTEDQEENVEAIYTVASKREKMIFVGCAVRQARNRVIKFQADCGASCNVVPKALVPLAYIRKTERPNLRVYNNKSIRSIGKTTLNLTSVRTNRTYEVEFVVVEEMLQPIIGRFTAEDMNLITINYEQVDAVGEKTEQGKAPKRQAVERLATRFPRVFDGQLGRFPGEVSLTLKAETVPSCNVSCKVPPHLREQLREKLKELAQRKVIEKVDLPTQWVNRLSIQIKKTGDLRICLDPRQLNQGLIREVYHTPAFDEILPHLSGVRLFSKFDLADGFWHCKLDEASSHLTTFQTPFGRFRFLRMPFGLNVAPEIFYKNLVHLLEGLEGTYALADDVLVVGRGETQEQARKDHDRNLEQFLHRCQERGIKLNKAKTTIRAEDTKFFGFVLTQQGLQMDPDRREGIAKMTPPKDVIGLRSFLGMLAHVSRFLPDVAQHLMPLRELCRTGHEWHWGPQQEKAFRTATHMVSRSPVLAFLDPNKALQIECDASKDGLGAALIQDARAVYFASRSMTSTEKRYAQIEKELLAIKYALHRFHYFIFPKPVTVYTDHRPLINIVNKSLDEVPLRLQRMLLSIQRYNAKLVYRPGREMKFADALSRCPVEERHREEEDISVVKLLPMRDATLEKLREVAGQSEEYRQLVETVRQGWPESKKKLGPAAAELYPYRTRLTVENELVLFQDTIVVPRELRSEFVTRSCYGHMSPETTWQRARSCIFWPGIKRDIEEHRDRCEGCQTYPNPQRKEPLKPHETPSRPWQKIGMDVATIRNEKILVVVCYYSNLIIAMRLPAHPTTSAIIARVRQLYSMFGICEEMITDSDPLFRALDFQTFVRKWNTEHRMSSPHHHQSNGKAESAVAIVKRIMYRAEAAGHEWERGLMAYNDTPQAKLGGATPTQMFHSRRLRTELPRREHQLAPTTRFHKNAIAVRRQHIERMKRFFDRGAKTLPKLRPGDAVRVKPTKLGVFEWMPARVVRKLPYRRFEVRTEDGSTLLRNRVHLHKEKRNNGPASLKSKPENIENKTEAPQNIQATIADLLSETDSQTPEQPKESPPEIEPTEDEKSDSGSDEENLVSAEEELTSAGEEEVSVREQRETTSEARIMRDRTKIKRPVKYQS